MAGSSFGPAADALENLRAVEDELGGIGGEVALLTASVETTTAERDLARGEAERLADQLRDLQAEASALRGSLDRKVEMQRAVAADLVKAHGTLQARSRQLQNLLESRWYKVARSSWQVRRRRPPAISILLALLAIAGAGITVWAAADPGALVAGLLGAAAIGAGAALTAVVVPALRDGRVPRMAGDESYVRSVAVAEEALSEPRAAVDDEPQDGLPAKEAISPPVTPGKSEIERERKRWLVAARVPDVRGLRVAGILDEMSRASFAPECVLDTFFTRYDWRDHLEANPPDLLLVESAWVGNQGGWQYCIGSYEHPQYAGLPYLRALLEWCREREVPTVFWNKEDPVHFDRFKEAAALFDCVFTTDEGCVGAYEELAGGVSRSVAPLPFAAQPKLHNPIPLVEARRSEPVFAGTYYRDRHPDRKRSLEAILDAARPHGLIIYDRTLGSDDDAYGFPERFLPHIRGRLSYAETVAAYKGHKVFLNVNSVVDSKTMFSRRVFELLACGTAVLSTRSAGMEAMFGELVPVANDVEGAQLALSRLLQDDGYRQDIVSRAQRLILGEHTYRHRLIEIARAAGFDFTDQEAGETAVLLVADHREQVERATESVLAQSTPPEEILLGLGNGVLADGDVSDLSRRFDGTRMKIVPQAPDSPSSDRFRELAGMAATRWVAPIVGARRYDSNHLRDLVACARFADAEVIGLCGAGEAAGAHRYRECVPPDRALAQRDLVAARGWPGESDEMRRWFAQGVRFYTGDPAGD
jgi:Glycosyl transferases group 1